MKIKKLLCSTLIGLATLTIQNTVDAYGAFWYDKNVEITALGKAMLFPMSNMNTPYQYKINANEYSLEFKENDYLFKQFSKKISKLKFYRMAPGLFEKEQVTVDKYSDLLIEFPNEKARANAVYQKTAADMYLVPLVRDNHVEKHISPRKEFDVQLSSWTEVYNAPGYYHQTITKDKRTWTVHHVIPETPRYLRTLILQFTGYDEQGNKLLTFVDGRREYEVEEEPLFKNITKYFRKEFNDVKKGKKFIENIKKANGLSIGFKNLAVPANVGNDEYNIKAVFFAMKDESFKRLKNVNIKYNNDSTPNYYVEGTITDNHLSKRWIDPSVSVSNKLIRSEESKWKDNKGNEHTQRTSYYTQEIRNHYGHYVYTWVSAADLRLVDAKNNQVVISKHYSNANDKLMDSYREIFKNFYNDVNKILKNK